MKHFSISDAALKIADKLHGGYYTFREKLNLAKYLASVKADAAELPPVKKEREDCVIYKTICAALPDTVIKIDAGVTDESAKIAAKAVSDAKNKCLQIILPVSTVQMEYIFHKKAAAMKPFIAERVAFARTLCDEVEFVAEDASRADESFLSEAVQTAVEAGATSVTISDDAGVWLPEDAAAAVSRLSSAGIALSVRPSDKIGVGVAVAAACVKAGAAGVVTSAIPSDLVNTVAFADFLAAKAEEIGVSANLNVTAIHHDAEYAVKKEIAAKETEKNVKIRITGESTLSDVIAAVTSLGYDLSDADAGKVYEETRRILNRKNVIESRELEVIIAAAAMQAPSAYHLESYVVNCGNVINATAQITLSGKDGKLFGVGAGDGPIDAAFKVIEQIIGHHYELDDFQIQTVTEGRESVGHALVKLRHDGKLYSGNGVSTDIVGASVRAYLNALSKIVYEGNQ